VRRKPLIEQGTQPVNYGRRWPLCPVGELQQGNGQALSAGKPGQLTLVCRCQRSRLSQPGRSWRQRRGLFALGNGRQTVREPATSAVAIAASAHVRGSITWSTAGRQSRGSAPKGGGEAWNTRVRPPGVLARPASHRRPRRSADQGTADRGRSGQPAPAHLAGSANRRRPLPQPRANPWL